MAHAFNDDKSKAKIFTKTGSLTVRSGGSDSAIDIPFNTNSEDATKCVVLSAMVSIDGGITWYNYMNGDYTSDGSFKPIRVRLKNSTRPSGTIVPYLYIDEIHNNTANSVTFNFRVTLMEIE